VQLAEMWRIGRQAPGGWPDGAFDLVEAAAGNGRLARDILDAAGQDDPAFLSAIRLRLVEASAPARADQARGLGPHGSRLAGSGPELPASVSGAILANELLDAMPPHLVVMRNGALKEVFVDQADGRLGTVEQPPSTPRLQQYLDEVGARLETGWYAEVNLAAYDWVRDAARRLERGFLLLIDYGHEARELYSATHASGTLMSLRAHASESRDAGPGWLQEPGARDLTSHVDLTGVRLAAEAEGLTTLGILDQTYFLLGLGLDTRLSAPEPDAARGLRQRLALKTLLLPGGMGSTHKVMVFARGVGTPSLRGLSFRRRLT
jgi:SAM-dependent MidA family methyltransferase